MLNCSRTLVSLCLSLALSLAVRADGLEKTVFTTPDGFVTVVTDTNLSATEAATDAQRIAAAYQFDRDAEHWADTTLVDSPVTVRVLEKAPDGILGRATEPKTFLIQLDYLRTPGSEATIAHELTHLPDFRELKRKHRDQYWLEGRANSNVFAYRDHL
ncbi:MAG: hypothetical protein JST92_13100, partial [Deltaproteobacteria bacterium]|nr:hypothetical protein [Deltaproteobacteria bacterium]